jgi:hypothetical protein
VASLNLAKAPDSLFMIDFFTIRLESGASSKSTYLIRFLMSSLVAVMKLTPHPHKSLS